MIASQDLFLERLIAKEVLKSAEWNEWMTEEALDGKDPSTLPKVLKRNIRNWSEQQTLSILDEEICELEASREDAPYYCPSPGHKDAIPIHAADLSDINDLPMENRRQIAFFCASVRGEGVKELIVLDYDPFMYRSVTDADTFAAWESFFASKHKKRISAGIARRRMLTTLKEALESIDSPRWKKLPVKPATRAFLEPKGLDPYWENATHVYTWIERDPDTAIHQMEEDLSKLLYKHVKISRKPYSDRTPNTRKTTISSGASFADEREAAQFQIWSALRRNAINAGASDIHIQPNREGALSVCIRESGHLKLKAMISPTNVQAFYRACMQGTQTDALKNLKRPKDARGTLPASPEIPRDVDFRYALKPGPGPQFLPKVVIRILDPAMIKNDIRSLVKDPVDKQCWDRILSMKQGMVIVSGPTGSGKSVTLYATLQSMHNLDPGASIQTVEDPIEYQVGAWLHQSEVDVDGGSSFQNLLRISLRTDTDILMLGEIRDPESAGMSAQFAASGHQLLSTIHADSSTEVVNRFHSFGVDSFQLSKTIKASIAQRLVAYSCIDCQRPLNEAEQTRALKLGFNEHQAKVLVNNDGCKTCGGSGVKGRTAIQEFTLVETEEERKAVMTNDTDKLRLLMNNKGYLPLIEKAKAKALNKEIPLSEIEHVLGH